jgi:cyclopropane-fatty-acyl-phospholipid synthase
MRQLKEGCLIVESPEGVHRFGRDEDPAVTVRLHDDSFFSALAFGGHVGAAEAYVDGSWSTDDLTGLIQLFVKNRDVLERLETGFARFVQPLRALLHALRRNTRKGSRSNIAAHYDLSNDFFKLFLDETMTYSCGIFERPDSSLEDASIAKYDRLFQKLELQPQDHLLEIGTGWGGCAIRAAREYGCRVTTCTISAEQHKLATERVAAAGLSDRISVILSDYRDLDGSYDKLISIEMIEAVGHHYFKTFFETCARLLKPHGRAAIQAITIQDRFYEQARREVDFIKRYIFPGSCMTAVSVLAEAARDTDLRLVHLEDITPHYAETLRHWRKNFLANWDRIRELGFSAQFRRLWELYFCYCEGGFREAVIGDVQMLFAKPHASGQFGASGIAREVRVA